MLPLEVGSANFVCSEHEGTPSLLTDDEGHLAPVLRPKPRNPCGERSRTMQRDIEQRCTLGCLASAASVKRMGRGHEGWIRSRATDFPCDSGAAKDSSGSPKGDPVEPSKQTSFDALPCLRPDKRRTGAALQWSSHAGPRSSIKSSQSEAKAAIAKRGGPSQQQNSTPVLLPAPLPADAMGDFLASQRTSALVKSGFGIEFPKPQNKR